MKMFGIVLFITSPIFGATDPDTTSNSIQLFGSDTIEVSSNLQLLSEKEAQFPGGGIQLEAYVLSNIQYPSMAIQQGIEGKVIASFQISKEGIIENIQIIKGIGGGCDDEVIRILSSMPIWEPALQNGNRIKTTKRLAFNFKS